jgi:hypothetical protein
VFWMDLRVMGEGKEFRDHNQNLVVVIQFYHQMVRHMVRGIYGVLFEHKERYLISVDPAVHKAQIEHHLYFQKRFMTTRNSEKRS